ncbi:MAG: hypothetical protein V3V08_18530 [Nannocystaceae bacterium]
MILGIPNGPRATRAFTGLVLIAGLSGCVSPDELIRRRSFEPAEQAAASGGTRVELLQASYAPQLIRLSVQLINLGETRLQLKRAGILLAYDGLEYAIIPSAAQRLPQVIELPAGGSRRLELAFRLARSMTRAGKLLLRGVARSGLPSDTVELVIPAAISVATEPRGTTRTPTNR